jgi:site-specific recombinase XerD
VAERQECSAAASCDFLLVNLFRPPVGAPMTPDAIGELIERLAVRGGLRRRITPHMLRHGFGSTLADTGATLDEIQHLMGHKHYSSSQPYLHPDPARLRAAVNRVTSPRLLAEDGVR